MRYGIVWFISQCIVCNSDIISLNIELNEKTKNFISYREIDLMKRDVYIINTSRELFLKQIGRRSDILTMLDFFMRWGWVVNC